MRDVRVIGPDQATSATYEDSLIIPLSALFVTLTEITVFRFFKVHGLRFGGFVARVGDQRLFLARRNSCLAAWIFLRAHENRPVRSRARFDSPISHALPISA